MHRYIVTLAIAFVVTLICALPLHSLRGRDLMLLRKVTLERDAIVLFGNSVSEHVSKCDKDRRTLPQMIAADSGQTVADISRGGLTLGEMTYLSQFKVVSEAKAVFMLFPVSPEAGFVRTIREPVGAMAFFDKNFGSWGRVFGIGSDHVTLEQPPVEYEGRYYGTYGEFAKTHFLYEKQVMRCPETQGHDRAFVRFMYWRNLLQPRSTLEGLTEFRRRMGLVSGRSATIVFVLMPVNFDDLRELHGEEAIQTVKNHVAEMRDALSLIGNAVLDLSEMVPASGFADRWCACGHLNEAGRGASAHYIAERLRALNSYAGREDVR